MPVSFLMPKPGGYKKAAKDLVVSVLAEKHPLSLKEIANAIRRHGSSVTYQAVRKAVNSLVEEGVLSKDNREYEISTIWIGQARQFIDGLQRGYLETWKPLDKVEVGGNVVVYTVKSLLEVEKLWGDLLIDWAKGDVRGKVNTFQASHLWFVLGNLAWERRQLESMRAKGVDSYVVVYSDTFLDKVDVKFYRDFGIKTKMSDDRSYDRACELGTYGDLVIQCYWPKEIVKKLDAYYGKVERMDNMNLEELVRIVSEKHEIKVTAIKDAQLAKQIQKGFMESFEEEDILY